MEELQHDVEDLRKKLREQDSSSERQSPMALLTAAAMSDSPTAFARSRVQDRPLYTTSEQWPQDPVAPMSNGITQPLNDVAPPQYIGTVARELDGYRVEGEVVDVIYQS